MEETTYLKQKIKNCRHKFNIQKSLENCVYYISFEESIGCTLLVEGISFVCPFTMRTILQQAV